MMACVQSSHAINIAMGDGIYKQFVATTEKAKGPADEAALDDSNVHYH
jgi:hypothetical protein